MFKIGNYLQPCLLSSSLLLVHVGILYLSTVNVFLQKQDAFSPPLLSVNISFELSWDVGRGKTSLLSQTEGTTVDVRQCITATSPYIRRFWRLSRHRLESELLMGAISWALSHSQLCSCSHKWLSIILCRQPKEKKRNGVIWFDLIWFGMICQIKRAQYTFLNSSRVRG